MAEKKFGQDTYKCEKVDATQGLRLLLRTIKLLGPASGIIGSLAEKDKGRSDAIALEALAEFFTKLDVDEAVAFVSELIGLCQCNREPAVFGVTPQYLEEALPIAFWVLEVQFKDFLSGGIPGLSMAGLTAGVTRRRA